MYEEHLVSRLSARASQVLLSLLLARQTQVHFSAREFASRTGLPLVGRSIPDSLSELEQNGLIRIVAQRGEPVQVSLVHPQEFYHETTIKEVDPERITGPGSPALLEPPNHPGSGNDAGRPGGMEHGIGSEVGEIGEGGGPFETGARSTDAGLLEQCRLADLDGTNPVKRVALRRVWDETFPKEQYPYQRLTNDGVSRLLSGGRSVEAVCQAIIDAPGGAASPIKSPLGYVVAKLQGMERGNKVGEPSTEDEITDEIRRHLEMGRKQFGA